MATNKPVEIEQLFGGLTPSGADDNWFVVHTKPRQEKKLAQYSRQCAINYFLPLQDSTKVYNHRKIIFTKPLFPGYIFLRCSAAQKNILFRSGAVVRFIKVPDEDELLSDLINIYQSTEKHLPLEKHAYLSEGYHVRIKRGPFLDVEGIVVDSENPEKVIIGIHLIQQAVCITVNPEDVELLKK
ncbi:MAG: hypothetical protein K9N06_05720 [Candidatus Cloacimonetes bacterium]|nr:hypothetical protein [Candidatus Cloacimonadota bacterium]